MKSIVAVIVASCAACAAHGPVTTRPLLPTRTVDEQPVDVAPAKAKTVLRAPAMIPGTTVPDTPENREVLAVIDAYRDAMVARDADALLRLAHPLYRETQGTPSPDDDYGYPELERTLRQTLGAVTEIELRLRVDRVQWHTPFTVQVRVESYGRFRLGQLGWQNRHDFHLFELMRFEGEWRFIEGF